METRNQQINLPILAENKVQLAIKREDSIHPYISGNKYRKLKYNLQEAKAGNYKTLLTFGGAFSNHIAAAAYAGQENGFKVIGVIRGHELQQNWTANPTLTLAAEHGMQFYFVDRATYKNKTNPDFITHLKTVFGSFYLVPEGGTNALAIKGCEEILTKKDAAFDVVACSVGTGGTVTGLINTALKHQKVLGFSALKGDFQKEDIRKFARNKNWELVTDYHFGGYAKVNKELVVFVNSFKNQTGIPLDCVYTAKMLFGIISMVKQGQFKAGTKILAIHTGGLQGNVGMNQVLKKKNLPLIDL